MKVIAWNCNMAFRRKTAVIMQYAPDILVVPECECPEKLIVDNSLFSPADFLWFGANKSKGLGVFSFGKYRLRVLEIYNPAFRTVVPIQVTGGEIDFNLFAVCANNPDDKDGRYVQQVWKAVNFYSDLLTNEPSVLAGDFNSNTIWDKKRRTDNHSDLVRVLQEKGIASAYHSHFRQKHGEESISTFYLYRHLSRPYHIDYCFASKHFMDKLSMVQVGDHETWKIHSDHTPLIVSFSKSISSKNADR